MKYLTIGALLVSLVGGCSFRMSAVSQTYPVGNHKIEMFFDKESK